MAPWHGLLRLTVALLACAGPAHAAPTPNPVPSTNAAPLLARPAGGGAASVRGLAAAVAAPTLPRWPVLLSPLDVANRACDRSCAVWARLDLVMNRAAEWLATFPTADLGFDAAVILAQIRQTVDSDVLGRAFEHARAVAAGDADNPLRAFWDPTFTSPPEHTARWSAPTESDKPVNTNRPLSEALHCRANGWRPQTTIYVCGPMRDGGGYETTHALWTLGVAFRNGCVDAATYEPCARAMQDELAAKQSPRFTPTTTLDIDLFAERALNAVMTGYGEPVMNQWATTLVTLQHPDGSWGVAKDGEPPYWRYHATATSTWALAEWYRRMLASPALRPASP